MDLINQKCIPCEGGVRAMTKTQAEELLAREINNWTLDVLGKYISKKFKFKDFKTALNFVNKVGEIAESEGHHPDIHLTDYNQVLIVLSTHVIGGLSHNDFILAVKIDVLI